MREETSELLSMIGAMQTLIENFPMGILTSVKAKTYTSVTEFMMDCLAAVGIGDAEIIDFILTNLLNIKIDVNNIKQRGKEKFLNDYNEEAENSKFVIAMESAIKAFISTVLTELLSCTIHPRIPDYAFTNGVLCPLSAIDPDALLNICPTSKEGKLIYNYIDSDTTPDDLWSAKDMNAFLWYCLYKESCGWSGKTGENVICTVKNENFTHLRFIFNEENEKLQNKKEKWIRHTVLPEGIELKGKFDSLKELKQYTEQNPASKGDWAQVKNVYYEWNTTPASLYKLNKLYLDNITIFTGRALLSYFIDYLFSGQLPSITGSFTMSETAIQGSLNNIIKNVIENDDQKINNCYYTFSNEEWIKLLEESELRKFHGVRSASGEIAKINSDEIVNRLTEASNATLHEQKTIIKSMFYDVQATAATDTMSVVSDGWTWNYDWVINITTLIITPFVRCLFSPQVMALIMMNFEFAGILDLTVLDSLDMIIEILRKKILGLIRQMVKLIKDYIVSALLELFKKTIKPLIEKYTAKLLLEYIEDYMAILIEASECVKLFGSGLGNTLTQIDDVNYADITPEKITPLESIC